MLTGSLGHKCRVEAVLDDAGLETDTVMFRLAYVSIGFLHLLP